MRWQGVSKKAGVLVCLVHWEKAVELYMPLLISNSNTYTWPQSCYTKYSWNISSLQMLVGRMSNGAPEKHNLSMPSSLGGWMEIPIQVFEVYFVMIFHMYLKFLIFIKNVVAVAAYSRLASRSQAKFQSNNEIEIEAPFRSVRSGTCAEHCICLLFLAATKQLYEWYFLSVCPSVCPSVRLSVCHTFLTMFPSSYHHEIFRSYHIGPG